MTLEKKDKDKNIFQIIKNYWNGKYSLVGSFWFGFMILGTIITVPAFIFTDSHIDTMSDTALLGLLVYFAIMYPYIILAYVGTWRSASNYKPKKGQWSWGTIAKVYIALNAIRAVIEFFK